MEDASPQETQQIIKCPCWVAERSSGRTHFHSGSAWLPRVCFPGRRDHDGAPSSGLGDGSRLWLTIVRPVEDEGQLRGVAAKIPHCRFFRR